MLRAGAPSPRPPAPSLGSYAAPMPTTPPADPDSLAVLHALSQGGLSPEDAYNALEALRNMAAANLIARFESKLDAQNAIIAAQNARLDSQKALFESKLDAQNIKLDAQNVKLDAQDTKLKMLMWMIGAAVAVLGILVRLWG